MGEGVHEGRGVRRGACAWGGGMWEGARTCAPGAEHRRYATANVASHRQAMGKPALFIFYLETPMGSALSTNTPFFSTLESQNGLQEMAQNLDREVKRPLALPLQLLTKGSFLAVSRLNYLQRREQ